MYLVFSLNKWCIISEIALNYLDKLHTKKIVCQLEKVRQRSGWWSWQISAVGSLACLLSCIFARDCCLQTLSHFPLNFSCIWQFLYVFAGAALRCFDTLAAILRGCCDTVLLGWVKKRRCPTYSCALCRKELLMKLRINFWCIFIDQDYEWTWLQNISSVA